MNRFFYGFCASTLSSLFWPFIPPIWCLYAIGAAGLLSIKKISILAGFLGGIFWVTFCFYSLFEQQVTEIPRQIKFNGQIVSLVSENSEWISINVKVLNAKPTLGWTKYYRLSWRNPEKIKVGEVWQFNARVKPISSYVNQGGFNQQKYLISQHVVAKGYIKQAELISESSSIRENISASLLPIFKQLPAGDIVQALILGNKSLIDEQRWVQLRQTGTGHLIAISGLHLSVVFGFIYWLSLNVVKRNRYISRRYPNQGLRNIYIALAIAGIVTAGFGYLSGFAIATQRALVMLFLIVIFSFIKQVSSPWQRLLYALFGVLLLDPFASLSAGFWLSFSALAIILFALNSLPSTIEHAAHADQQVLEASLTDTIDSSSADNSSNWQRYKQALLLKMTMLMPYIKQFWGIQWRLAIGLGFIQAVLFGQLTIHSIWINFIFVPWFSVLVIPLAIIGLLLWLVVYVVSLVVMSVLGVTAIGNYLDVIGEWIFLLPAYSLQPYMYLLETSDSLPFALVSISNQWLVAILGGVIGIVLLRSSRYFAEKLKTAILLLGIIQCLPLFYRVTEPLLTAESITNIDWQMHVVDVGQGSAIIIQRQNHGVLYDTGAAYGESFSYAERAILPVLAHLGIDQLDYLIVSHSDNDHSGGVNAITKAFPNVSVIWGHNNQADVARFKRCANQMINWNGLTLQLNGYDVTAKVKVSDNNLSCVMHVSDEFNSVLLSGDIERLREYDLLGTNSLLAADILLAPHHGSRTSSSDSFIDAVSPKLAIFSAGYINQYGFPKPDVLERYHSRHIDTLTTGRTGQISVSFSAAGYQINTYRQDMAPFWYNRLFRFGMEHNPE